MILSDPNCTMCRGLGNLREPDRNRLCVCSVNLSPTQHERYAEIVEAIKAHDPGALRRACDNFEFLARLRYVTEVRDIKDLRRVGTRMLAAEREVVR